MTSVRSTEQMSLLDLPAEIRLRIYEFAIPQEIILQTWDHNPDISKRVYNVQLAEEMQPRFMFTNKLVHREALPIFWDRVILDHSFLPVSGRNSIGGSTFNSQGMSLTHIKVTEADVAHVRKIIISARAEGILERVWPCVLPNLKSIDIAYPPADVDSRELQRMYMRIRASQHSHALNVTLHEYFGELFGSPDFSRIVAMDLWSMIEENKYNVSISLLPIKIYQCWTVDNWSGLIDELRHDTTALLKYDCNTDTVSCRLVDSSTTRTVHFQDTVVPEDIVPSSDDFRRTIRQVYRAPKEIVRMKSMDLLGRLVCREVEDQGMIPALSVAKRVPGHL